MAKILQFCKRKPSGSYEMALRKQRIKKVVGGLRKRTEKPRAQLVALRLQLRKKEQEELDNEEEV